MSVVIWKYPILSKSLFSVEMPADSRILSVMVQNGTVNLVQMWALCDTESPQKQRWFRVLETGEEIDSAMMMGCQYIGTFQIDWMVWHLFEDMWYAS